MIRVLNENLCAVGIGRNPLRVGTDGEGAETSGERIDGGQRKIKSAPHPEHSVDQPEKKDGIRDAAHAGRD